MTSLGGSMCLKVVNHIVCPQSRRDMRLTGRGKKRLNEMIPRQQIFWLVGMVTVQQIGKIILAASSRWKNKHPHPLI